MAVFVQNWNGRDVEAARSRGGVLAFADFSDNLILPVDGSWPPAEVVQKLVASGRISAFDLPEKAILERKLGYYCNLQSIHSEDAITWTYFGLLSAADIDVRVEFLNWLLLRMGLKAEDRWCSITLWRRIPHPDKLGSLSGPEVDFLVQGDRSIVIGEAKWLSAEDQRQGTSRRKGQIQLRKEFLGEHGIATYGSKQFAVLLLQLEDLEVASKRAGLHGVNVGTIPWSDLCDFRGHPRQQEFRKYYEWKYGLLNSTRWRRRSVE
jgi:hypothetical protein